MFGRLARVAANPAQAIQLRTDAEAIAPERAIVFEVAGSIADFYEKAANIGLEYLADDELEIEPDDNFRLVRHPEDPIVGRVYLAMPDTAALRQLVSLWRRYVAGEQMDRGFGMWTQLFHLLKNVRAWGPQDRLLPETLTAWQERLIEAPNEPVRFEVDLWYRESLSARTRAFVAFQAFVDRLGGAIINDAVISEIRYHAVLLDLPAARIRELIADPTVSLARVDEVMYIRPQSMAEFSVDNERSDDPGGPEFNGPLELPPIAALIDGLPVQNHSRLAGRLDVDDPEGLEAAYQVSARKHGTEMASLILHGDLNRGEAPLSRPLHVRPVMQPVRTLTGWEERTPDDRLLVDYIYRAIRRIKEGESGAPPTAPTVILINVSLGDPHRSFAGPMSPWARLLDHLAFKYRVLFLVSAGNIRGTLALPDYPGWSDFEQAAPAERQKALFRALDAQKAMRTLFSPAEAMNVLTIGAAHADSAPLGTAAAMAVDPYTASDAPNLSSAIGLGYRKVVKPDLLLDGGREFVRFRTNNPHLHVEPVRQTGRAFGLLAAAPDPTAADLTRTALTWGTSAATALATRAGHLVYDALMVEEGGATLADVPDRYHALIVKALLVHGASWGPSAALIEEIAGDVHHTRKKDHVSRFLGYGVLDLPRILACTAERATLVGYGDIAPGTAGLYRIPLPAALEGIREQRSVTVTAAWFAPINPKHQGYRMVALEARPGGDDKYSLGVGRAAMQPHADAINRGTIFHDRREGDRAVPFVDGGDLLLRLSARGPAGEFTEAVPYALAVSLEVGVGSTIGVYDAVREAIALRARPPIPA